ncbi:MAG: BspA family leucine-rich repeat surface protein [Oscillospiraceae bacterium]|nr:BspA family leucine-rich repeat surface protein [Oscillospiraceae bacterium]
MRKWKKAVAAGLLSLALAGGGLTAGIGLFSTGITARAAETAVLDKSTHTLTLSGNVVKSEVQAFAQNKDVETIKCEEGTVLPADCRRLFAGSYARYINLTNADASKVTTMKEMFGPGPHDDYDDAVTDYFFDGELNYCKNLESVNMNGLDTSNVTDMSGMFLGCKDLEHVDLTGLNTEKVTDMGLMFAECGMLEELNLSSFRTSNVRNMGGMFYNCGFLRSLDLSQFDTSKLVGMTEYLQNPGYVSDPYGLVLGMFRGCQTLEELDLRSFDTSNVYSMRFAFSGCKNLKTIYVSDKWTTENVMDSWGTYDEEKDPNQYWSWYCNWEDMKTPENLCQSDLLFYGSEKLVGGNGTAYDKTFYNNTTNDNLVLDIPYACIDGRNGKPGYFTFIGNDIGRASLSADGTLYLDGYVTKGQIQAYGREGNGVRRIVANEGCVLPPDCSELFYKHTYVAHEWITDPSDEDWASFFGDATEIDLSKADASKVTDMSYMFAADLDMPLGGPITHWENIILGDFDTCNVTNMKCMFMQSSDMVLEENQMTELDVSSFDTSKVTDMSRMFYACCGLTTLDLSSFDTSNVKDMTEMFGSCYKLETIFVSGLWNTDAVTVSKNMFWTAYKLVGGNGTIYDKSHLNAEYARIDGLNGKPGYLTLKDNYAGGVSLSLDGTIHVNFYVLMTDKVKKAVLSGPYHTDEITDFRTAQTGQFAGYTKLSYAVNATQRNSKITLKLYDKDGKQLDIYNSAHVKAENKTIGCSAADYFKNYTGEARPNDTETITRERNELVTWLEKYMKAAENYFLGTAHKILDDDFYFPWFDTYNVTNGAYKLGLTLNSGTDLLIYTDADSVVHEKYGGNVNLEKITDKNGLSCFVMPNIPASQTVSSQAVIINGETYYVCPRDYCAYVLSHCEEDDPLAVLAEAFYMYSKSAEHYVFDCTDD